MIFAVTRKLIWRFSPIAFLPVALISGCNSDNNTSAQTQSTELVFPALESKVAGMSATLNIEDMGSYPLVVSADNAASASIPDLAPGPHTMTVTYSANGLTLAEVSKVVDVAGTVTITVAYDPQDINKNFDYDLDGWVNLAEILWGSEPTLYSSTPPGESPKFVVSAAGGEAASTNYTVQSTLGESMGSQGNSSSNYALSGGFQSYH